MWANANDLMGFQAWAEQQMKDSTTERAAVSAGAMRPDRSELVRRLALEQRSSQWLIGQLGAALETKEKAEKEVARLTVVNGRWESCCFGLILACVLIFCWAVSK